jgi:hypothetical protein
MLGSEELTSCARTSWPASRITPDSAGCLDSCNACSADWRSVSLALGDECVGQLVDDEAEIELPRLLRSLASGAGGYPGRASPSGRAGDHCRNAQAGFVLAGRAGRVLGTPTPLVTRAVHLQAT